MTTSQEEVKPSLLHDATTVCQATGFNTYQSGNEQGYPQVYYTSGEPRYGMVVTDFNAGLRLPQSRPLVIDSYNSGCLNPHGCVNNQRDGFTCGGPVKVQTKYMRALYDDLNGPYAPNDFDLEPPAYVMGIKNGGINSVTGWAKNASGQLVWEENAIKQSCKSD